jgi:hypothetical protein
VPEKNTSARNYSWPAAKFQMLRGPDIAPNDGLRTESMRWVHHAGEKIQSMVAVRGPGGQIRLSIWDEPII